MAKTFTCSNHCHRTFPGAAELNEEKNNVCTPHVSTTESAVPSQKTKNQVSKVALYEL